jgi:hypothetical protein
MLSLLPCLAVGATTNSVAQMNSLSMFCIRYGMDLGPLCTPAVLRFASGDVRGPEPDCVPVGPSLKQPRVSAPLICTKGERLKGSYILP